MTDAIKGMATRNCNCCVSCSELAMAPTAAYMVLNRVKPSKKNTGKQIASCCVTIPLNTFAPAIRPGAEKIPRAAAHIPTWVRPAAPTPAILPIIISLAVTVDSMTSMTRDVFSSRTARITLMPYNRTVMYMTMAIASGARNAATGFDEPPLLALTVSTSSGLSAAAISVSLSPFFCKASLCAARLKSWLMSTPSVKLDTSRVIKVTLFAAKASSVAQMAPSTARVLTFSVNAACSLSLALVSTSTWHRGACGLSFKALVGSMCRFSSSSRIKSPVWLSVTARTRCLGPPRTRVASKAGPAVMANIRAGMKMVIIKNARERTRSRYSRFVIKKMLCIVLPHRINEDFFERRFHQLELADAGTLRHRPQELLRVRPGSQPHLNVVAIVVVGAHQLGLVEKVAIALVFDLHVVLAVLRLDLLQVALQNGLAVVDQTDGIAQLLHLVHLVRRKQDSFSLSFQVEQDILQQQGVDRIETTERFIHDDEIRIVQQGSDKLNLLLHAFGKLFH